MSEIQSIAQNNYILSNMAAQKLYAQSPLTTGMSGTSAYIGIEPSALCNETVLWSGDVTGGVVVNLSESLSNFNKFAIVYSYWSDGGDGKVELESRTDASLTHLHDIRGYGNGDAIFMNCFSGNNTAMQLTHNYYWNPPANQSNKTEALGNAHIYEIRGINRKENV